ncbi:ammonia-dependent NAD(+) synthetase [Ornithinibacillus halotolerans]|uniref:NH(3)-dependent NAD(+) synthetase n=1 Tax=Ornithinibacillus halotolerans TaxID=1274357 RepID=A0A916S8C2_9BACI|nr:ammonia-dependent NAD(+) synthetase [Ornithinibacillus halotolerans]GGA86701.1 NH(3)-dependent NAD(+) synthetase [Ornithinibacillus halotolerans]
MSNLQNQIIGELKVQATIEPKVEIRKRVDFLKNYLLKHPFAKGYVLGISGGQDSTLAAKLAQIAVNELNETNEDEPYQFIGVRLPYGEQFDEDDCQDAIDFVKPSKVLTVNIKNAVDASVASLEQAGVTLSDFIKGNEKARERMKAQYSIGGMYNCFILGTDHAAEAITGFFTKHGDGACDLIPLYGLNKRQGKILLKELGCPEHLYAKVPTADLEENKPAQPDEVALGVTYEHIDDYLEGKEVPEENKKRIENLYMKSRHKRHQAVSIFDDWWK